MAGMLRTTTSCRPDCLHRLSVVDRGCSPEKCLFCSEAIRTARHGCPRARCRGIDKEQRGTTMFSEKQCGFEQLGSRCFLFVLFLARSAPTDQALWEKLNSRVRACLACVCLVRPCHAVHACLLCFVSGNTGKTHGNKHGKSHGENKGNWPAFFIVSCYFIFHL